ncbi:MAG: hypothetical protein Q7S77_00165 [Candidatus Staskawiczbacteria bacterium]|nr:hypothetical protein [Candidatus Staskawiczbacteria bacterium]
MLYGLPDADFHKWEKFEPLYHIEAKAPIREEKEYHWDYLGEFNIQITSSDSTVSTTSYISMPFFGSFS